SRKPALPLNADHSEAGVKPFQIERVARDDCIACRLRADHDVSIRDVGGARLREQRPDGLCLRTVQGHHLGFIELDHSPKAYLLGWIPNDLRESRGRYDDPVSILHSGSKKGDDPAIVSFQRNQPTGVKCDSAHATFCGLAPRFRGESIFRAHARSFAFSGPPVSFRASSTMARNSAAFSRDFWTAC